MSNSKPHPLAMYQIVDWNANFEGAKSRTYSNKTTCQMPTKHGLGYKRLVKRQNGAALFGAWCALVQVCSRHRKERNGYCTDTGSATGKPYTASDLGLLTDISESAFAELFQVASSQEVGWLRIVQGYNKDTKGSLNSDLDLDFDSDSNSNPKPPVAAQEPPVKDEKKPRERNLVMDALSTADGGPEGIPDGKWRQIATALKEIRTANPEVTPEEIKRRIANYRTHFADCACTCTAVAKHWALCATAKQPNGQHGATATGKNANGVHVHVAPDDDPEVQRRARYFAGGN